MTDTPPVVDSILVSDLRAELTKSQAETAALRAVAQEYRAQVLEPPTPIVIQNTQVTTIETEYELLSGEIRRGLSDGVKVGGATLVVLGIAAAVLPSMNLPAADLTAITAMSAAISAFLSWAARHGITAQSK